MSLYSKIDQLYHKRKLIRYQIKTLNILWLRKRLDHYNYESNKTLPQFF